MGTSRALVAYGGMLLVSTVVAAQPTIRLSAFPAAVRIDQSGVIQGAESAVIAGARNECESFQVVVTAVGGRLEQVEAVCSALSHPNGAEISRDNLILYREAYVPIRYSSPRATCPPGLVPDPLIPFVNPYTGEPIQEPKWGNTGRVGPRFGASRFDVWPEQHQPLWVDVRIPKEAPPGVYRGAVKVSARDADAVELPVELTVWDFTLPDGPTHENHFGGFGYVAQYHHLDADSEEFRQLEERYIRMMAEHRLNPPLPRALLPKPGEDGTVVFDDEADQGLTTFVEQYHVTNVEIPRAPFPDVLGADREKALRFYRSWYAYLDRKGWAARAYLYMLDEPNDAEAYERVRRLGALVHEAEPRLRRLVVEQPYTQDPSWGVLDDAIDIWCPLFGFIHEPSIQRVLGQGDAVWSYTALIQTAPPYHPDYEMVKNDLPPFWQMDFPLTSYRIAPWLNRRYGITGLLYWSTVYWGAPARNPWDDPGFRVRWNGEGALFYPGAEAGIEGPVASMRLKNLRDGMEDYEYFAILEQRGGTQTVADLVRDAVATWGTWRQEASRLIELRQKLAEEIMRR